MATKIEVIKRWLTLSKLFMISWLLRILLILYGELQDKLLDVKFTDIDYKVFSDAAGHVLKGNSPYDRHTYRYTPIVAWLLIPNHILFYGFGKLVFISFDVLAGWIMYKILSIQNVPEATKMICCVFWLLNPLTAVVSSRGNAESIMALLLVLCIYTLMSDRLIVSAVLYGTAVHMKIYPIIYSLSIVLNIDQTPWERVQSSGKFIIKWNLVFTRKKVTFVFVSVTTFLTITSLCYLLYGWEFLYEAFIYHVVRTDIKHNFSVYFYMLYLTQGTWVTPIISLATFLPQFMLVFVTALKLHRDLPFCCFVQTFLFVTFNKVCTSQYFLWYLTFLPLIIPSVSISMNEAVLMIAVWFGAQGVWLLSAYLLEFQGMNTFIYIWIAGLFLFVVNVWIIVRLMKKHVMSRPTKTKLK